MPADSPASHLPVSLMRRLVAEALGTSLLLATVVGSGIMGASLAQGNVAIALLANALATGAGLVALIAAFGPISGAHFNPVVTLTALLARRLRPNEAALYVVVQVAAAVAGVALAHAMFAQPLWQTSQHARAGAAQLLSEGVATFGLIGVILGTSRHRPAFVPIAVGAYITAAYWFTASTSFANPAVTFARAWTDTFAGIRPVDVPGFVVAQLVGGGAAALMWHWLLPEPTRTTRSLAGPAAKR
jgi:glycerol uptake facilitator-like aquaporin